MKFKYQLPPELVTKCSEFSEFANGGAQVTILLKNGKLFKEALVSNSMYLVAMRGHPYLPFSIGDIADICQTEEDKNPSQRGNWDFWDDWQDAT
ncbi:hypothetical protein Pcar_3214 [Syntrophotalea carbinolica DSM 2380]|uniref:Uncharacterized protein n=1 Tax=Syntrophotalea carbinolica (strain DSM 2380 / NBRC 103641 / GraBd1) TaxID=338963 RepID=Q0C6V3_SYNC1|nr:hypothetical protein [Syntrophotalea carbinolica]ABI81834.1 hypothetical protein Pcar_3214 [Syntrophotalea carbinolica DSM 2380]